VPAEQVDGCSGLWPLDSEEPVSGSPTGIRPHPRRQINVDFSQLARVNISTLPSLGKETSLSVSDAASSWQRLCPTAWEIRTSGPLGPRLSYPLEHQSPRADPVRDTSLTRRRELSMAMSINDVDTRINHEPDN
jgi:hypothetical protein